MSKRRRTGITLIELMVSMVVFGACAAPIVGAIAWVSHHTAMVERRAAIMALLQDKVADAVADFDKGLGVSRNEIQNIAIDGGTIVQVRIVSAPVSLFSRRYSLIVTADWTESRLDGVNRTQTMQFATRLYNE